MIWSMIPGLAERGGVGSDRHMPTIDFWFDFASTYSYPAAMRIAPLAATAGVAVRFRPFLLGPIFEAQGWDTSPFHLYPAKERNMWRALDRVCGALALPFRRPYLRIEPHRQPRTRHVLLGLADRVLTEMKDRGGKHRGRVPVADAFDQMVKR